MVDISGFRRDAKLMEEGEWVSPGVEYGDFMIRTKAIGPKFHDAVAARVKLVGKAYGGEDRIPSDKRGEIATDVLVDMCLIDVKGLADSGKPIDFKQFCDLIRDPNYVELNNAAFIAAGLVGRQRQDSMKASAGNSAAPSEGTSKAS